MTVSLAEALRRQARRAISTPKVTRCTMVLRIPEDVHAKVVALAKRDSRTLVGIVTQALMEFFGKTSERRQTDQIKRLISERLSKPTGTSGDASYDRGLETAKQACIVYLQRILSGDEITVSSSDVPK